MPYVVRADVQGFMNMSKLPHTIIGSGLGRIVPIEQGRAMLDAITVVDDSTEWMRSELLDVAAMAARIGVARSSIHRWCRSRKILAFTTGNGNCVYPVRQFECGHPIAALDQIFPLFAGDEVAWEWLVTENPYTDDQAPIDWLRQGNLSDVMRAAEGRYGF